MRNSPKSSFLLSAFFWLFPFGGLNAQTQLPAFSDWIIQANATDIIKDTGVANRLAVGEVLRTMTQEIPAAVCHLRNQIDPEDAADLLAVGVEQVDELLDALLLGDVFWGIEQAETRRKTIAEIEALRADWAPIQNASRRVLADYTDQDAAELVFGAADLLMDRTYRLLTMLDAEYSTSAEIQKRDVMFIQISGRMAALQQRSVLDACLLASRGMDPEMVENLTLTMGQYQNSLQALTDGLPAMGILPPQTPGIAAKLEEIRSYWHRNRPVLDMIVAGQDTSDQMRYDLYNRMIDEHVSILDLVYLYQDHSKVH